MRRGLILVLLCLDATLASAQAAAPADDPGAATATDSVPKLPATTLEIPADLTGPLPVDPLLTIGKLDNGLTYYIRTNRRPADRMELRLVVNVGSVLEEEEERGLAHFIEHMAFNGTRRFEKQELVSFLESIGTQYGADLNAYTSFNETVYMLHLPTDSAAVVEKAFDILEDWAHGVAFEDAEVEKERGVVIEEWREGRGAGARIRDQQLPVLFKGSRYAERLPIGTRESLEGFRPEALRRFYERWYRPDLMAVVAVGDFDKDRIERLVRDRFASIPARGDAPARPRFDVPNRDETLFAIASDPEASRSLVAIHHKRDAPPKSTLLDYRRALVELLHHGMVRARLDELTRRPDPPILFGFSSLTPFTRSEEIYVLGAAVSEDGFVPGLEAIVTESARLRRHGFTESELDREKSELLRSYDQAWRERDKTESAHYAALYTSHFLIGSPVPGIEYEHALAGSLVPRITLDDVNGAARELLGVVDRVVTVDAPRKPGLTVPSEAELLADVEKVEGEEVSAYQDEVSKEPLLATRPRAGRVVSGATIEPVGVTEWRLSNGVRVVLKPTDFKNDEVLFTAFSPGGHSRVADEDFVAAITAPAVVAEAGLGPVSLTELQKRLAGKLVSVSPYVGELQEGMYGQASPGDLEAMFELIYLYFTAAREDSSAFASLQARMRAIYRNRSARPESALEDTLQVTLTQGHPRGRPWSEETFARMSLARSLGIYRDRFADAGDFTFVFAGAFEPAEIRPLVETYLGGLASLDRGETWRDVGMNPLRGIVKKTVRRGLEPKSEVRIVFTGPFTWTRRDRLGLTAMGRVLENRLHESLREEMAGTYSVEVSTSASRYPDQEYSLAIAFASSPERVGELLNAVFDEITRLKRKGPSEADLTEVKEALRRDREENLRENRYWLSILEFYYFHGEDPAAIPDDERLIRELSAAAIQKAAGEYLDTRNYVQVVLEPETPAGSGGTC